MAGIDNQGVNLGLVQDVQNLDKLRQLSNSSQGQEQALRAAAGQFEAIFSQTLFQGMRQAGAALTQDNPMNSSYTQFYEGMLDQQRVADMASKGGLGIADMVVRQLSPKTFRHDDGRTLRMPERTEQVYKPYALNLEEQKQLGEKLGKDFAEKEARGVPAKVHTMRAIPPMGQADESKGVTAGASRFDSPSEFVHRLMPMAKKAAAKLGLSPAVLVAQAALESGWGKRVIRNGDGEVTHNLFGIKADPRWEGPKAVVSTLEYEKGTPSRQKAAFRSYESFEESFNDYVDFLTSGSRYRGALAKADNPDRYFEALQAAGYATDPHYARKLKQVLRSDAITQYTETES
ncbi:flagellar assembly peptidoglycan hydrolase FlgJ [Aeromonas schubertii]|uniref:flagellar assembly peptidoglycan hydrolase FlgJ n=1 Tax=Aeromonas schubertii TaxID=652 RepID=UPI0010A94658|nr:flagellar assembly peptidoglycan hydrolase FlgJ [Aeromonas schubertii]QCG48658.1 flagellar assembly peptidoglycan hydrolase FlgJ [Aeromonas schubertii]